MKISRKILAMGSAGSLKISSVFYNLELILFFSNDPDNININTNMKLAIPVLFSILLSCKGSKKKHHTNIDHGPEIEITEKPIPYTPERAQLSIQYLKDRHNVIQTNPSINPIMIVLHYTDGGTTNSIYKYFSSDTVESVRELNKKASPLNVSSHYLIDREGKVYHLVPDTLFARHIIGLNYCSIGIENIGSKRKPLTEAQVISNAKLIRYLTKKYKIEFLIGHSEYENFRNSKWWKETDPGYFTVKEDPGKDFLERVRYLLQDINLKNNP